MSSASPKALVRTTRIKTAVAHGRARCFRLGQLTEGHAPSTNTVTDVRRSFLLFHLPANKKSAKRSFFLLFYVLNELEGGR